MQQQLISQEADVVDRAGLGVARLWQHGDLL